MYQSIVLLGRLGKDPDLSYTSSQTPVCKFSVAVSKKWNGKEHTEWFNVVVWNKMGEYCNQYLAKGNMVFIEGELRTRSWEDAEGAKRYSTEVVASEIRFVERNREQSKQQVRTQDPGFTKKEADLFQQSQVSFDDDDIPF